MRLFVHFAVAAAMAATTLFAGCGGGGSTTTPPVDGNSPVVSMTDEGAGVIRVTRADGTVVDYVTTVYQEDHGTWVKLTASPNDRSRYYIKTTATGKALPVKLVTTPTPLAVETVSLASAAVSGQPGVFAFPVGEYNANHTVTVRDGNGTRSNETVLHFSVSVSAP